MRVQELNKEIIWLLEKIREPDGETFAKRYRKRESIKRLTKILKELKSKKLKYLITRYRKDGIDGFLYRRGKVSKVEFNGKLTIVLKSVPGFPKNEKEIITIDSLEDIIQLELEEN